MEHPPAVKRFVDTRSLEIFLASITALYGLWLLSPIDTYNNVRGMKLIATMLSECQLGVIALAVGAFKLLAAYFSKYTTSSAIVGAVFWGFMAGIIFPSQPYGFAGMTYLCFAAANLYIVARGG